jgi:hypothetical protein
VKTFLCPVCSYDVQVDDIRLSVFDSAPMDFTTEFRIETRLKHVGSMQPECGEFFMQYAKEQSELLDRMVKQASQNLHGL